MAIAPMWLIAALAGAICVATRALPWHDVVAEEHRVGPILLFLAAITLVAELADIAEVFDVAAVRAARLAGGKTAKLFALVLVLGTATTVVLSLDTTAVLLTPVVLTVANRLRIAVMPFAFAAVWLANTASLLLPVSNLTNLLAAARLHTSATSFAATMWLPALGAVIVTAAMLGIAFRKQLRGSYALPDVIDVHDPPLFRIATATCLVLAPLFVTRIPVWITAVAAAVVLAVLVATRERDRLRWSLVPWRLVVTVQGLFLVVTTLGAHGLDRLLGHLAGHSDAPLGLLRTAGVGAAASNVANNLPGYLALERVADGRHAQVFSLLLGTNVGPLVLLWGSLATLLWRDRCRARGVDVSAWQFAKLGVIGTPILILATWGCLLLTR